MNDNDIINILTDYLQDKGSVFNIFFDVVDKDLDLPSGSTKKHIETAADESDFLVVRKGEVSIRLQKKPKQIAFA